MRMEFDYGEMSAVGNEDEAARAVVVPVEMKPVD